MLLLLRTIRRLKLPRSPLFEAYEGGGVVTFFLEPPERRYDLCILDLEQAPCLCLLNGMFELAFHPFSWLEGKDISFRLVWLA